MDKPFSAYRGEAPYVFVCYSHADTDLVYREIAWLHDYGVNIWYDEGISPGREWSEELASAIQGCSMLLFFVTQNSVDTEHCRRELSFAQEEGKDVVAVHLKPAEVPAGLRLSLNNRQAIVKYELADDEYLKRLMRATHAAGGVTSAVVQTIPRASSRWQQIAWLGTLLVLVVAGAWWWQSGLDSAIEKSAGSATEQVEAPRAEARHAIAVLPFANLSPDPDNAFFAAGIHDELLTSLAKVSSLKVISRTSVLAYADSPKNVREIAD